MKLKEAPNNERASVWVKYNITMIIEPGKPVLSVLLDLSVAFDTVDKNVPTLN